MMATGLKLDVGSCRIQSGTVYRAQLCHPKPCPETPFLPLSWRASKPGPLSSEPTLAGRPLNAKNRIGRIAALGPRAAPVGQVHTGSGQFSSARSVGLSEGDSSFSGRGASARPMQPSRVGRGRSLKAVGGTAGESGEAFSAGPSGRGDDWEEKRDGDRQGSTATIGGPLFAVLDVVDRAVRFVIVKAVLVVHGILVLGGKVCLAIWRLRPIQAVKRRTIEPIVYGEGAPSFKTPWILKPFELVIRIALFFVPSFVKRRVGPVLMGVFGTAVERSLALVQKTAKQGLGGVREWAGETSEMAREGAPAARQFAVRVMYRVLQFFALTLFVAVLREISYTRVSDLAWIPKSIVKAWQLMWVVIDYVLLDMDWVQPLQRLIVEVIWPFWRDYWILVGICTYIFRRLYPGITTKVDLYANDEVPAWYQGWYD